MDFSSTARVLRELQLAEEKALARAILAGRCTSCGATPDDGVNDDAVCGACVTAANIHEEELAALERENQQAYIAAMEEWRRSQPVPVKHPKPGWFARMFKFRK